MQAFHSFWTAPNRLRGGEAALPDYELLTMMLSALEWRKHNGPIRMLTDSAGADYFRRSGLDRLWSEPIGTALDEMDPALDPAAFWAAGKLEALGRVSAPCVMLDTDLVIWKNLDNRLTGAVVAAHREELDPGVYPDPLAAFEMSPDYAFPAEWDFTLPAANTAFLYMPDEGLKTYYIQEAFRFMAALQNRELSPTVTMCFAEQRVLPMCAAARGFELWPLLDQYDLDAQDLATHLWGAKRELAAEPERRVSYCLGCVMRLLRDFPEWEETLARNPQTAHYYHAVSAAETSPL